MMGRALEVMANDIRRAGYTDGQVEASLTIELADDPKRIGGIVIDDTTNTISRANVHFIPDPRIPTDETGTRFRTADRLASQTGLPILAVSEEGRDLAVVFVDEQRFVLQAPTALFAEANQRLQSLERLRARLDHAAERLSLYEIDDIVTMRDAVKVIQRAALVLRHVEELDYAQIAEILGVPGMRHDASSGWPADHVGPQSFAAALPRLAEGCRAVTGYAQAKGIKTMVENHGFFCQESQRVEQLVTAVEHANFGVLVDAVHELSPQYHK